MTDPRNVLQAKFEESTRFANFRNILVRMHVRGFRCHANTVIDISSPITAFCGLNGTGKSTLLQLAAVAYKKFDSLSPQYYIKDFMVVGTLDPAPFRDDAMVEFHFWQEDRSTQPLKISRDPVNKKWRGYRSRKFERKIFFAGVGLYLPKIERRDFTIRNALHLFIEKTSEVEGNMKDWICKILGCSYDKINSNSVTHSKYEGTVISVCRSGIQYSEPHMGYGEARSQNLINALEKLPDRSLVLIEEPETSLHPSAQYQFGKYLISVATKKCHQILLTTHSEFILESLPSSSRVYLNRVPTGIDIIPGLTTYQAKSLMAEGNIKALHVLVEDECASAVLSEIIRRIDPVFLSAVGIYPVGDADIIARTVRTLRSTGLPVVSVKDGDMGHSPSENIFRLPGSEAPEKELFANVAVKAHILSTYGVILNDFMSHLISIDHHEWFEKLAKHISHSEFALIREIARVYANSISETEASTLTTLLKESIRK